MDRLLARLLLPVVIVSGVLTVWMVWERALLAAPLAVVFVTAAFVWTISRPFGAPPDLRPVRSWCPGCPGGCVECRERIDLGDAA